jgi:hypothetical protein
MEPNSLAEMAGADTWTRLGAVLTGPVPPNLILCGPAGVGKSHALRLALPSIAVWLNCSADPTLRDNRERIKTASRRRGDGLSWIVLEHADVLHVDAQAFLRRIIEKSATATRFVLEVRDAAAIAEPLLSRTVLFTVPALLDYEIRGELIRRGVVDTDRITRESTGNMRWASLQATGSGLLDSSVPADVKSWGDVLAIMESIQATGSSPRAYLDATWDRPGGICPWAVLGLTLGRKVETGSKSPEPC